MTHIPGLSDTTILRIWINHISTSTAGGSIIINAFLGGFDAIKCYLYLFADYLHRFAAVLIHISLYDLMPIFPTR